MNMNEVKVVIGSTWVEKAVKIINKLRTDFDDDCHNLNYMWEDMSAKEIAEHLSSLTTEEAETELGYAKGNFHCLVHIGGIHSDDHAKTHVVGIVHHLLCHIALSCHHGKDRRDRIAVFLNDSMLSFRKHTGNILIETAASDMAACLDAHAGFLYIFQCLHIDPCGC